MNQNEKLQNSSDEKPYINECKLYVKHRCKFDKSVK